MVNSTEPCTPCTNDNRFIQLESIKNYRIVLLTADIEVLEKDFSCLEYYMCVFPYFCIMKQCLVDCS
jgi:hypothetical protein